MSCTVITSLIKFLIDMSYHIAFVSPVIATLHLKHYNQNDAW